MGCRRCIRYACHIVLFEIAFLTAKLTTPTLILYITLIHFAGIAYQDESGYMVRIRVIYVKYGMHHHPHVTSMIHLTNRTYFPPSFHRIHVRIYVYIYITYSRDSPTPTTTSPSCATTRPRAGKRVGTTTNPSPSTSITHPPVSTELSAELPTIPSPPRSY